MEAKLTGYTVAFLVADGFEESELTEPKKAFENAGAQTVIISPEESTVRAWKHGSWSNEYPVDEPLITADPYEYDALVLPGGVMNPDTLRLHTAAIDFIATISTAGKPIGAICHGPWTLINAALVSGKTVTSWPSLSIDLENAGATWVNQEVVVDGDLVTSRKPDDLPAFNQALIDLFTKHNNQ